MACRGIISENVRCQAEDFDSRFAILAVAIVRDSVMIPDMDIQKKPCWKSDVSPMRKGHGGETLVAVVVGAVVLALSIMGLVSILSGNSALEAEYEKNLRIFLLERNTEAVLRKTPVRTVGVGEEFFLEKDALNKRFSILTGTENANFRFVNDQGERQDPVKPNTYRRTLVLERSPDSADFLSQSVRIDVDEILPTNP